MKDTAIYKAWSKLKADLAPMSNMERLDHLWTYYRGTAIVIFVFAFLIGYLLFGMLTSKDTFLGGIHANVELSDEGINYISSDFFELQQGDPKKEVSILNVILSKIQDDEYYEMNYYYLQAVTARVGAQKADYILSDKVALEIFMTQDMLMDLREFFTEEDLVALQDRLIYLEQVDENGETTQEAYPVAVDISDLPFFENYGTYDEPIYFSVAVNTLNLEKTRALWDYLTSN